jgi:acyl-coenzyme A synthetase/AMP-(fatty) acid ligase
LCGSGATESCGGLHDFDWQLIFAARLDLGISILEAAVVAQSDPIQGQLPFAFYQLREGAAEPSIKELQQWLGKRVDPASTPDSFVKLERWPITGQGKLDRSRLSWLAESGGEACGLA